MDNMESTGGGGEFSSDHSVVIGRRKRSKRQRPSSPLCAAAFRVAAINSSYSSGGGGGGDGGSGSNSFSNDQLSPSISTDWTAEVEEEVVDCLMLLAKGSCPMDELRKAGQRSTEKFCSRRTVEMATGSDVAAAGKDGYVVYECKTCYRTFPSFQALGGHSASHKRPKFAPAENTERSLVLLPPLINADEEEEEARIDTKFILSPLPLQVIPGKGKAKVHGCSICGTEFMSGQALGGHMRRHRTTMITPAVALNPSSSPPPNNQLNTNFISTEDVVVENRNNMLMFDLNLPAPEDHHRSSNSEFTSASRGIDFLPIFG